MLGEKPHHGWRVGCRDPMLHLVELKFLHRPPYRIGVTPLAHVGLEAEPVGLREAIERLEVLDRLRELVTRQVQSPVAAKLKKRLHPSANILDTAMTRHRELR